VHQTHAAQGPPVFFNFNAAMPPPKRGASLGSSIFMLDPIEADAGTGDTYLGLPYIHGHRTVKYRSEPLTDCTILALRLYRSVSGSLLYLTFIKDRSEPLTDWTILALR